MTERFDVLIVGGGAAGIAAAKALWAGGCRSVALVEEKPFLGGILRQCVHPGFGPDDLDGRACADRLLKDLSPALPCFLGTTVTALEPDRTARLSDGRTLAFRFLILAAGCREIPFGALPVTGTRPRGVFTAGQLQEMMNVHDYRPQGPAVILGSGDIGLVMAWQLLQLGLPVTLVEQASAMTGLPRNRDRLRGLPLTFLPNATIREIAGWPDVAAVVLSDGRTLPCRTLLSAVGLRPERELLGEGPAPDWVILAGNCRHIHPTVESVLQEGAAAAARVLAALG